MFKIGDFSKLSRISVKALRYYDEIGLLKPVKVDHGTGYRYYSADQLPRLNYIIALKYLGLSLEEIATLIKDSLTPAQIREIFMIKRAELKQRLNEEQQRLTRVEELLKYFTKEGTMPDYQVTVKNIDPQTIASIRAVLPTYGDVGKLFEEVFGYLGSQGITRPVGPTLFIGHDPEFKEQDVDVEIGVPIDKAIPGTGRVKIYELHGMEQAACTVYKGPYEDIGEAYSALMAWIESNGYQITGPDRELYLTSPADTSDPAEYVTEIQFPIEKT